MAKDEYIIEAECPCCGELIKFRDLSEVICPCGDMKGRLDVEWEIVRDEDNGS